MHTKPDLFQSYTAKFKSLIAQQSKLLILLFISSFSCWRYDLLQAFKRIYPVKPGSRKQNWKAAPDDK